MGSSECFKQPTGEHYRIGILSRWLKFANNITDGKGTRDFPCRPWCCLLAPIGQRIKDVRWSPSSGHRRNLSEPGLQGEYFSELPFFMIIGKVWVFKNSNKVFFSKLLKKYIFLQIEVGFLWLWKHVNSEFVAKIDSDTVVHIDRLYSTMKRYEAKHRYVFWCKFLLIY